VDPLLQDNMMQTDVEREDNEISNLERSLEKLLELLQVIRDSVDEVVTGSKEGDSSVGRFLTETLSTVPMVDTEAFSTAFGDSMRDLLMVVYLSKLTQTQLHIAEKLLTMDMKL